MTEPMDMKGDWNRRAVERPEKYIAGFHDQSESVFQESGERDVRLFFAGLEHLLAVDRDVVDIGCGIGRMDMFIAPRVRSLRGVDVSGEMVKRATERLKHLPNVAFLEGDGYSLPLESASADLIYSHIVFQHIPRKVVLLYFADAYRVLRPGGAFLFQIPGRDERMSGEPPDSDSYDMRFWTVEETKQALSALGFLFSGLASAEVGLPGERFQSLRFHVQKPASA